MARRYPNHRLVKIHRTYTVEEVGAALGVHKHTVRNWLRQGLPAIDGKRPTLILGRDLLAFLQARSQSKKQHCRPGELYCVRCRRPVAPAGNLADYLPFSTTSGNLRGICPHCDSLIHRRVALARIGAVRGNLEIAFPRAEERIGEGSSPPVNCDSEQVEQEHGSA